MVKINSAIREIRKSLKDFAEKVTLAGKEGPTNAFLAFSGHGTSMDGLLHLTMPTLTTDAEFMALAEEVVGALWTESRCESLQQLLENFDSLQQKLK